MKKTELTVERVLEEMKRHAFYDITEILNVDEQGNVTMRDPTSLPEDRRGPPRIPSQNSPLDLDR